MLEIGSKLSRSIIFKDHGTGLTKMAVVTAHHETIEIALIEIFRSAEPNYPCYILLHRAQLKRGLG